MQTAALMRWGHFSSGSGVDEWGRRAVKGCDVMESRLDPAIVLTERKVQILRHLASGQSVQEISKGLGISAETVYEHIEATRRRLTAHSNPELIRIALRHGFVAADD
jgi:DNA-binding CsgD family transcriptional regulator